jgi:hypothetical protein
VSDVRSRARIIRRYQQGLQALLIMNALDAVFTSWWVAAGWASEANPVMARVLEQGLGTFIFVKLAVGIGAALFLRGHGHRALARVGVTAALIVYAGVVFLHLHASASQYVSGTLLTVASR